MAIRPTIGRSVHYHVSKDDEQLHQYDHNTPRRGDILPMTITRVDDSNIAHWVNGNIQVDNGGMFWKGFIGESNGSEEGKWFWPPIVLDTEPEMEEERDNND